MAEVSETWTALYYCNGAEERQDFESLRDTLEFLWQGEEDARLSTKGLLKPDGTEVLEEKAPKSSQSSDAWLDLVAEAGLEDVWW